MIHLYSGWLSIAILRFSGKTSTDGRHINFSAKVLLIYSYRGEPFKKGFARCIGKGLSKSFFMDAWSLAQTNDTGFVNTAMHRMPLHVRTLSAGQQLLYVFIHYRTDVGGILLADGGGFSGFSRCPGTLRLFLGRCSPNTFFAGHVLLAVDSQQSHVHPRVFLDVIHQILPGDAIDFDFRNRYEVKG